MENPRTCAADWCLKRQANLDALAALRHFDAAPVFPGNDCDRQYAVQRDG
jgi:hypothetical protein